MGSLGLRAPLHRPSRTRQLLAVRILQLLINVGYVSTIGITSGDSGRWTYESIEMAAALGGRVILPKLTCQSSDTDTATAATLTLINFAFYLTRFDPIIHPVVGPGRIKQLLRLLVRIVIDLFIGALWCSAFAASFHRKTINFQKLFAPPPYKTWTPAVIFTLIECGLLFASASIILAEYYSSPPQHTPARILEGGGYSYSNNEVPIELTERGNGSTFGASIIRQG
ncbi:MAG: hypothetical protein Q9204_007981 [Flavoplaca sp. TL-2023a]